MIAQGSVAGARDGLVEARIPGVAIGDGIRIGSERASLTGEVIRLHDGIAGIAPHQSVEGVRAGNVAIIDPDALKLPLGMGALGRMFDARGAVLDGGVPLRGRLRGVCVSPPPPEQRSKIREPFWTGVRVIDGLLTLGRGSRIGIFGPAGAGKSTLLQMLLRGADADAIVVALVGERGREAEEWMRFAPARASIVCATSDRSAAERVRSAHAAMAQAHELRARGLHVLLVVDSLARFGSALRELALASGESSGRGGFPPSVFAGLAAYVEIAGATSGSVTLVGTMLCEDDTGDPLAEAARSLLDGHVQLSRELAHAGRFPAIDVLSSASRTMAAVTTAAQRDAAQRVRAALAALRESADARSLGIAPDGLAARAAPVESELEAFLRQGAEPVAIADVLRALSTIAEKV